MNSARNTQVKRIVNLPADAPTELKSLNVNAGRLIETHQRILAEMERAVLAAQAGNAAEYQASMARITEDAVFVGQIANGMQFAING
jgi:hypothetical protein